LRNFSLAVLFGWPPRRRVLPILRAGHCVENVLDKVLAALLNFALETDTFGVNGPDVAIEELVEWLSGWLSV
jgi:hypothetical protein